MPPPVKPSKSAQKATPKKSARAPRAPRVVDPSGHGREQFLMDRILQLARDQATARRASSWIAVRQLGQDLDAAHKELAALREKTQRPDASAEEILAEQIGLIRDEANGWPEEDVEQILRACQLRLGLIADEEDVT